MLTYFFSKSQSEAMKYLENFDIGKAQVFMHGYVFENCGREVGVCLKQIFI